MKLEPETPSNTASIVERHLTLEQLDTPWLEQLSQASKLSQQLLKKAMSQGAVWLTRGKQVRRIRRKNAKLKLGDEVHLYYHSDVMNLQLDTPELIADEGDYSVWNKPYGVWSQGSKWGDHCSIGRMVEAYFNYERTSYVVHRLDRAANGLIIVAHNKNAAARLSELFASRTLEKTYRAVVEGEVTELETVEKPIDGKTAISHVRPLEYKKSVDQTLVEVAIETGRKHQIRIHLASIDHPIIGDRLHGNATEQTPQNLQLTAYTLAFTCPITQEARHYQVAE